MVRRCKKSPLCYNYHLTLFLSLRETTLLTSRFSLDIAEFGDFPASSATMGVLDKLSRKTGVIVGDDVLRLFEYAQENNFAIPAIVSRERNL